MTPINIGIVGLGFMAATHIKAYRQIPGARVAALCSRSGKRLNGDFSDVAGNVGSKDAVKLDMSRVKAYRDFDELLADPEILLIDLCTPTPAHVSQAIAALEAGKHVLCEKPLARNSDHARRIVEAAGKAKGFLMPSMCLRFWPEWAWLKRAIEQQTHGKVLSAHFRRVAQPPGWSQQDFLDGEKSGGALLDLHVHDVDFIQFCFGRPRKVFSSGYSSLSGAVDHVFTHYLYDSGPMVTAEGGWAMSEGFGFNMTYTVNFENATADYDLSRGKEALKLFQKGRHPQVIKLDEPDGFVGELTHMIQCVQEGKPPSVVTARDGLSAIEICEAEERSVRTRSVVEL